MNRTKLQFAAALLAVAVITSGCVLAVGNSQGRKTPTNSPTLGQQLIDLKTARESGAISPQDYEIQKHKLLSGEMPK